MADFLAGVLLALLVVAVARSRAASGSFFPSRLRRLLLEWSRGKALIALSLVTAGAIAAWILGADGVRVVGAALPEAMAWVSAFEITTLVDILAGLALVSVAAWATWIHVGMRESGNRAKGSLARVVRRGRLSVGNRERAGPGD